MSQVNDIGNLRIIDPNSNGPENGPIDFAVPLEDLSVSVELRTIRKERTSIIAIGDTNSTLIANFGDKAFTDFIRGTKMGDRTSLSTHYTEIGSNFSKLTDENGIVNDMETLGITNISIDFNASCAPMVTMTLVDVRGNLFQNGNKSPYAVFFDMPYPIFNLTVKGFYGQGVRYDLHLMKFNTRFNSENGSFEIACEFIGYTYAYLSDLLIGYLKGIPYTKVGGSLIENPDSFLSFKKLNNAALETRKLISKVKDSTGIKSIQEAEAKIVRLNSFKETILGLEINKTVKVLKDGALIILIHDVINTKDEVVKIVDFEMNDPAIGINSKIELENVNSFSYTLNKLDLEIDFVQKLIVNGNEFKDDSLVKSISNYDNLKGKIINAIKYENLEGIEFSVLNLNPILEGIVKLIKTLSDDIKTKRAFLASNLGSSLDSLEFKPTIGNYMGVLCNHADLLVSAISKVASEAEGNETRRLESLKDIINNIGGNGEKQDYKIKAFPDYKVKNNKNDALEEIWIGTVAPTLPEVLFVEDLIKGVLESAREGKESLLNVEEEDMGKTRLSYYPIHVFDLPKYRGINNPYSVLNDSDQIYDFIKLLYFRTFLFLNSSNNSLGLNIEELKRMASIEANNIANGIEGRLKDIIVSKTSAELIKLAKDLGTVVQGDDYNPFYIEATNTVYYIYGQTSKDMNIGDDNILPFSIRNKSELKLNYLIDRFNKNLRDDSSFIGSSAPNAPIGFQSDSNGRPGKTIKTGATYVKIEKDIFGGTNDFNYITPDYSLGDSGTNVGVDLDDVINKTNFYDNSLGVNLFTSDTNNAPLSRYFYSAKKDVYNIFKNKAGVQKNSSSYDMVDGKSFEPFRKYFRVNRKGDKPDKYGLLQNVQNKSQYAFTDKYAERLITASVKECVFKSNNYYVSDLKFVDSDGNLLSVFGSKLYRMQRDEIKAYLFLGSIPFNFDETGFLTGKYMKLFTEKSGIVKIPYSWALYVGALLSDLDIEFTDDNPSKTPYMSEFNPEKNQLTKKQLPYSLAANSKSAYNNTMAFEYKSNFLGGEIETEYPLKDYILKNLPFQVKEEFKTLFKDWVKGEFQNFKTELEPFKAGKENGIKDLFIRLSDIKIGEVTNFTADELTLLNNNFIKNYLNFGTYPYNGYLGKTTDKFVDNMTYGITDFNLELKPDSDGSVLLTKFLRTSVYLVNGSTQIWNEELGDDMIGKFYPTATPSLYISSNKKNFNNYLKIVLEELKTVNKLNIENEKIAIDDTKLELFQSLNGDDIRLKVYKDIKSIYDKWISGSTAKQDKLIDQFRFIDRSYKDVSQSFRISTPALVQDLMANYNAPLYSHISRVLGDNNFNFFPLPNYIDLSKGESIKSIFKPIPWNEINSTNKPQFLCMYSGELSNQLDTGGNFVNDGVSLNEDGTCQAAEMNKETTEDERIPIFKVRFGDQNQAIFKSIDLNQSEFTASNESLNITDGLTKGEGIGQNLFDIYQSRSYSVDIEMMGNAMIQPFMYFMLENIPMFYGLYTISRVSHTITPGGMITKIKGYRIKNTMTKMVDDETLFNRFFSDLEGVLTDSKSLGSLGVNNRGVASTNVGDKEEVIVQVPLKSPGLISQKNPNPQNFAVQEVKDFMVDLGLLWETAVRQHNTTPGQTVFYNDALYYNGFSNFKGDATGLVSKTHRLGVSGDFRQVAEKPSADSPNNLSKLRTNNYSVSGTKKLINIIKDLGNSPKYKMKNGNNFVKVLWFNGVEMNQAFPGFVNQWVGHDDHIHIEFYLPDRITNNIKDGNIETTIPTNGSDINKLTKPNKSLSPNKDIKLSGIGKIKTPLTRIEKAMLDTIAYAEGTSGVSENGYNVALEFRLIKGWDSNTKYGHGLGDWFGTTASTKNSSAAGRYQFTAQSWTNRNGDAQSGNNKPFTEYNQDIECKNLIRVKTGSLNVDNIVSNNSYDSVYFNNVIEKLKPTWTSFKVVDKSTLLDVFKKAYESYS